MKTYIFLVIGMMATGCGQLVSPDLLGSSNKVPDVAAISLASASNVDLGSLAVSALSAPTVITIQNSGSQAATGCSAPTLSNSADFIVISTSCTSTLAAGASCIANVQGQPSATGARASTLTYTCSNGGSVVGNLSQVATPTLNGMAYASSSFYQPVTVGTESPDTQTVYVNNWDSVPFTGCVPYLEDPVDFTVQMGTNTCGSTLAAGGSCQFDVKAKPLSAGAKTSKVGIMCLDSGLFLYNGGSTSLNVVGGLPNPVWNEGTSYSLAGTVSGNNSGNSVMLQVQNQTSSADATNCHAPVITGDVAQFSINRSGLDSDVSSNSGTMGHYTSFGNMFIDSAPTAPGSYSLHIVYTCDNNGVAAASTAVIDIHMTATP